MRLPNLMSLAYISHQALASSPASALLPALVRLPRGRLHQRTDALAPRQDSLFSFITIADNAESTGNCAFFGKPCDGGCIPNDALCCGEGSGGGWCEADETCHPDGFGGCCLDDGSGDCAGPGPECFDDDQEVCGAYCVPAGSVCCDSGFFCAGNERCTGTGCVPADAVDCGEGKFCEAEEECGQQGCKLRREDFGFIDGAAGCEDGSPCSHSVTALLAATSAEQTTSSAEGTTTGAAPTETEDERDGTGHVRVRLGTMAVVSSILFVAM